MSTYPAVYRKTIQGLVGAAEFLTRPNNTTAYTAGDEISGNTDGAQALPFVFSAVANRNGGAFAIRNLIISTNGLTGVIARMVLFSAAPTMVGDNAVFGKSADRFKPIASIGLSQSTGASGSEEAIWGPTALLNIGLNCAVDSMDVYGVLYAAAASPIANQVFAARLTVDVGA